MGRVRGRAEENGRARGMQGSSGGASSLLYSAAVTVRFFDAVALALFACELRLVLLGDEHGRNTGQKTCVAHRLGSLCSFRDFRICLALRGGGGTRFRASGTCRITESAPFQVADPKRKGLGSIALPQAAISVSRTRLRYSSS